MTLMNDTANRDRRRARRAEEREFRMLLRIGFAFFLIVIALRRLMPWDWLRQRPPETRGLSIVAEARQAANNTIPYAFNC